MLQNVNNPIAMKYGALFAERESVIDQTNKALAPLLLGNFSSINNISIKNIQILKCELKPITNFMRDLDNPIHSVPYYLGSITINLYIKKFNQPIKLDVGFVIFFDKITNFQLNDTGAININDLNIDFLIDDKNYIRENKYTIEITGAPSLTVWDFINIVKPNIYNELELSLKEKINTTPNLRKDIIKKYKDFQLFMENIFEQDKVVDEIVTKMYESSLLSLAAKKNKTYLDSDIFYYDIGERYRANIIHNSPYNKYFLDELKLYDKGQSLNNPQEGIMKYVGNIIMDIGCGTGEKAEGLVQKIIHDNKNQGNEYCYIGFDTNAGAIYDSNYNIYREAISMSETVDGTREKSKMEDTNKPTHQIRYLFSEGMTNDLLDGSIKFCCLDNSKANLSILQKSPFTEIPAMEGDPAIDIFDHYKDIFIRDYSVEDEKKGLLKEMDELGKNWPSKDQPEEFREAFNKMKHLYTARQQKKEVVVHTEAFKKERKTIMVPGGTFGNFMQDDEGLKEYIKGLQDTVKKFEQRKYLCLQIHKRDASQEATYINNINAVNNIAQRMKEKNNSKRVFLKSIKKMLSNKDGDYALLTVFTKPNRDSDDFDKRKNEIEKIYNTSAFKQKYISLFRKMNIDDKDLEYSATYEDDDAIHIYIKVINPKGVFYTMGLGSKNKISDDELEDTIVHRKGNYLGITLPVGFTFHCQMSQRFSDEDMEKIIAFDDKNNPTGLQVIDQISTPEVESMKIFVIGLSDTI